jgi:L-ascorbate metabolism protein UlaG (beta-lactamase superfamily)
MVQLEYLGHSAFQVKMGNKTVLFDPWLDSKHPDRRVAAAYSADQMKNADLILISHEHFDHFNAEDIKRIYERTFAHVVAPENVFREISIPNSRKMVAYLGDKFNYQGFDIEVVEARHPQSKYSVGYIISDGNESVYFAGDTYDFHGLSKIQADVALIPIGGKYTMDVIGALSAVTKLRVKHVIPMHYNTFDEITVNPFEFAKKAMKESKVQVHVLKVGESILL